MAKKSAFAKKYGPWALIAGGSSGLGGAWTSGMAARGLNVIFTGRNADTLEAKAKEVREKYGVEAVPVVLDLSKDDALEKMIEAVGDREIGMMIYNAGVAGLKKFCNQDLDVEIARMNTNVRGPMSFSHYFGNQMIKRGKGGIILMSSGAGLSGNPYNIGYSASKSYIVRLAEGLWYELKGDGVDVLGVISGMVKSHAEITDDKQPKGASAPMEPSDVVDQAVAVLGKRATMVPGLQNKFAMFMLKRLMPTTYGLKYMGNLYEGLFGDSIE